MPVIAHSRHNIASGTLRCLNTSAIDARGGACPTAAATSLAGSRITAHMMPATMSPGMPTIQNTLRQVVISSSCVARMGPMPLPNSEMVHWKMPLFMPRRVGCEASTATATPVGATAPSATPMIARMNSKLTSPVAMPLKTDSSENMMTAGTRTLRRPRRSERPPMTTAETPHATPRMPTRLPRS